VTVDVPGEIRNARQQKTS